MSQKRKIVVGGFIIGFPLGGQVWTMLHWVLGLARLGHDVIFVEDSADWAVPFNPVLGDYAVDSTYGRDLLDRLFRARGLSGRWAYYSQFEDRLYGMERRDLEAFCADADLFLNISGVIPLRETFMRAKVTAVIDTDPVFTQVRVADDAWTRNYFRAHDLAFTFGHNIPSGSTGVPLAGIDWHPTRPPVVLDEWHPNLGSGSGFTTIGSWNCKDRDIEVNGEKLSWRKCERYRRIIDLPSSLPDVSLDLTMSGLAEDGPRFAAHGWVVRDAVPLSRDIEGYRDYIMGSTGEFTMAKEQNTRLKSGWFSDRSACYLAAGRPVIVEDTGFDTYLPVGEGLLQFTDPSEAQAAIRNVVADYPRHRQAARRIAEEYFASDKVIPDLLRQAGLT